MATEDLPTGLPGWLLLSDRIDRAIRHAARKGLRIAAAVIKVEQHDGTLAKLRASLRDGDSVTRLKHDEFVVLLPEVRGDGDGLLYVLRRMLTAAGGSIGVALYPEDGRDARTLLANAEAALSRPAEAGGEEIRFYSETVDRALRERIALEAKLRRAMAEQQLELHYQAKQSLADGRIDGCEALMRWNIPGEGAVPPARFIPLAEESGLIEALGEWAIETACRQLRHWTQLGIAVPVAVNISPRQFTNPGLPAKVEARLRESGVAPGSLELEITESSMADDEPAFQRALEDLKAHGLQLAVDDFGSGYSNLRYLKSIPLDELKIDATFISDLEREPRSKAIVRAVISLGHDLDLRVVAEGVGTKAQRDFLRAAGCDDIQGYYCAPPLPAAKFEDLLRRRA